MAHLEEIRDYLENRLSVITTTEKKLEALQQKYETFFAEISRARDHELDQLVEETLGRLDELPGWYREAVEKERPSVEKELHDEIARLKRRVRYRRKKAAKLRQESIEAEERLAADSRENDRREERLKSELDAANAALTAVETEIRSLSRGLGFFTNLGRMRPLERRRRELDGKRRDLAAQLAALRQEWATTLEQATAEEEKRRAGWVEAETEAAALAARMEALTMEGPRLVARTVVERVLGSRETSYPEAKEGDPPCPRCGMPNPPEASFCHICAIRLKEDRPDFEGSLEEIGELNYHHRRFGEGMKATQETLALVRGIRSGLEALLKSVREMIAVRKQHKLARLELGVPQEAAEYGRLFDEIAALVRDDIRLHPLVFASWVQQVTEGRVSEKQLKGYFEAIGDELSRAAKARWD
ncbi:MAG TPA: hypothetical protein ENK19_02700 [Acidobacteria bacterium]|nr:hypothetical protein [Acidobacteriota bacterium]